MIRYLLDTNAVIAAMKGLPGVLARLHALSPQEVGISAMVLHELYYGAYKSERQQHNIDRVARLQFEVLAFDSEDAQAAGEIRAMLARQGTPIGPYDVLIAGQAKARNLVLVSHNTAEFSRVPGLLLEDWEV